jgi:hypothetical protein
MNPRPALPTNGKPISTGKKGRSLWMILGILLCPVPVPIPVELKLFVRVDRIGSDIVCNFPQLTFSIACDCKYIKAARNKPAITAIIFITYLIAMPTKNPAIPPNPTVVKRGIKLVAFSATIVIF